MAITVADVDRKLAEGDAGLGAATATLQDAVAAMIPRRDRFEGQLEGIDERLNEIDFKPPSRVGRIVRRVSELPWADIEDALDAVVEEDGRLTERDLDQSAASDFLFRGRDGKGPDAPIVHVVLEVSITVDTHDVERAAARAAMLSRAGLNSVGVVGGKRILMNAQQRAEELGVRVIVDRERGEPGTDAVAV